MVIAILAYGSLIDDPGEDLAPIIVERLGEVVTPFPVEFAHASVNRGGGPTLVPVAEGGLPVRAVLLLLREGISEETATDYLYAREIGKPASGVHYEPDPHKPNQVYVESLQSFHGVDLVLYTRINPNVAPLTAEELARRAVASALGPAGELERDGIHYLMQAKKHGVVTPLQAGYEQSILALTGADSLEAAWVQSRRKAAFRAGA